MELFTYHSLDFDLTTQAPDPTKSPWRNDDYPEIAENFNKAYDYLYNRIGCHNMIWCYGSAQAFSSKPNRSQDFEPDRLWHLEVPDKRIIAIDSSIWDFVINNWYYVSNPVYTHFVQETFNEAVCNKFDQMIHDFYEHNPFNSYHDLIKPLKQADPFHDQFLIPAPIKKSWIIRTHIITPEKKPIFKE